MGHGVGKDAINRWRQSERKVLKEKAKGISGLTNASKLDKEIWDEFNGKWDELAYKSERLISELQGTNIETDIDVPEGKVKTAIVKQRVNQDFFRKAVLTSYGVACCITGLNTPSLLVASHIKPWNASSGSEKTNPCNGLCLNALHDKAFDRGLLTVTPDYKIHISADITDIYDGETVGKLFGCYAKQEIIIPEKFAPSKEFLKYHNDVIYENWR